MILTINGKIYEAHEKKSGKNFTKNRKETAKQQRKKWNKANMQTVSACMRKEDVQEFYEICHMNGKTAHQVISAWVMDTISQGTILKL